MRAHVAIPMAMLLVIASACGDAASRATDDFAAIDTLPGGVVRTLSVAPAERARWAIELLHVVQPADGEPGELLDPGDLALTEDGRVLVADEGAGHVSVYDADGNFVRTIGGKGEGPGEFRSAWLAVHGDTLFVQDPQVARGSTFRISTGEFLTSRHTACCYWAPLGVDGQGRAVMPMMRSESDTTIGPAAWFVRAAFGANTTDTVRVPQRPVSGKAPVWELRDGELLRGTVLVPLVPRDVPVADPRGGFITAWTGEYQLRVSRDGQDTVTLFGRSHTSARVTMPEKQAMVDARVTEMRSRTQGGMPEASLRSAFDPDLIPDVRPPFETFHVDPLGRTWVRRSLADTTVVELDLFSADRRWLDVVRVSGSLWPSTTWASIAWGADRVVTSGEDEAGRPLLRVFRIVRREAGG